MIGGKNMIEIEIDNASIQGLLRDLKGYEKEAQSAIDRACSQTANEINIIAKGRLSGMFGGDLAHSMPKQSVKTKQQTGHGGAGLMGAMYVRKQAVMDWVVGNSKKYAAYIEFAIGEYVFTSMEFSEEAKKVAAQFKGSKKVKGFPTNSFLNWAAVNQEKKHIERIEKELNKIQR